MKKLFIISVLFIMAAIAGYYHYFSPANVLKRATAQALADMSKTVATKDRAKIGEALQTLLPDDAHIKLDVNFFSLSHPDKHALQEFDKPTFITFIDNTLYALEDYEYLSMLDSFTLSADRGSAAITFSSTEWGDGVSYYGGTAINMRFGANTDCTGTVIFDNEKPKLQTADCQMHLRSVPKPGQEEQMRNSDTLREYLLH